MPQGRAGAGTEGAAEGCGAGGLGLILAGLISAAGKEPSLSLKFQNYGEGPMRVLYSATNTFTFKNLLRKQISGR